VSGNADQWLHYATDAHSILAVTDAEGVIIDVNDQFCRISGYSREELIGQTHRIVRSQRHSDGFFAAMWQTITQGQLWHGTICNRKKNGREYWVETTILPLPDESGKPLGYLALRTDVTRLKEAEAEKVRLFEKITNQSSELKLAETQLTTFFDHAPIGISWREIDEEGRPGANHVNQRFCEIIGLNAEEALDIRNVMRVTHDEDRAVQEKLTDDIYKGKIDRFSLQKRYRHSDGSVVWATLTVAVLRDDQNRVTHHFAMLEDITSRHAAEDKLRRSEARWRSYLEHASEILYALTPQLEFKFLSPAWTAKLGYRVDECNGTRFLDYVHPEDQENCRQAIERVIQEKGTASGFEYRMRHQNGKWIWHASSGSHYFDRDGLSGFFGVGRDIQLRKDAQRELEKALKQREELERIVNRSPSVVVLWKAARNGWAVEFISASIQQFGFNPEDFTNGTIAYLDITHPDDRDRVRAEVKAHAQKGDNEYNQEYRIVCPQGRIRWIDDHTIVRRNEEGTVTHHEGVLTDITERKAAEELAKEAAERELRLASAVQQHLLPSISDESKPLEVESFSQPSLHLGGDYYDQFEVDADHRAFVIADVSGKGAPAALMMSACRTGLRLLARNEHSPARVVTRLNQALYPDMPPRMFITLFFCIINIRTLELRYCRAGHEPALLIHADNEELQMLDEGGMAIGMMEHAFFEESISEGSLILQQGDLLALYTDGINEACNAQNEEFGLERMAELLQRYKTSPLNHLLARLDRHLRQFCALSTVQDDKTLLVIRAGSNPSEEG